MINDEWGIRKVHSHMTEKEQLSEQENNEFGDLCEMAGRFSDDEEELKIPNMYYSEKIFWIKQE